MIRAETFQRKTRTMRLLDWYQGKLNGAFTAALLSLANMILCIVNSILILSLALRLLFVLLSLALTVFIASVYKLTCILLVDYFGESPYFGRQRSFVPCRVP